MASTNNYCYPNNDNPIILTLL